MAKTFNDMVREADAEVPGIDVEEARRRMADDPRTVVVDARDFADRRASGMVEGAVPISSGTLPIAADTEVPEDRRDKRVAEDLPASPTVVGDHRAAGSVLPFAPCEGTTLAAHDPATLDGVWAPPSRPLRIGIIAQHP